MRRSVGVQFMKPFFPLAPSDVRAACTTADFRSRWLTRATDLRSAAAATVANNGDHPRAQAGAPLLAAATHRAQRRVRLAAIGALLRVDLATHAGALQHAAAHRP